MTMTSRHIRETLENATVRVEKPFTCHCAECGHEFAPFFLPIPITRMPKDCACPRGCTGKVYVGRAPENRGG